MVLLDMTGFCSPSRIRASTARSRFPFRPFSTVELRFSSGKPMSRSVVNLESMPSPDVCTLEPNTREGLFTRGGDKSCRNSSRPGEMGGVMLRGEVAALRSPNPKRPLGFGGNGGGRSSELVLPVFCRVPGRESLRYILCSYFALMYRSIALSTSSISMGICGLTLRGLYVLLDSTLPMRFMFYSIDQHPCLHTACRVSYINLGVVPLVHAQRLDFGDVRAQLAMQGCASHAQEDAQL